PGPKRTWSQAHSDFSPPPQPFLPQPSLPHAFLASLPPFLAFFFAWPLHSFLAAWASAPSDAGGSPLSVARALPAMRADMRMPVRIADSLRIGWVLSVDF